MTMAIAIIGCILMPVAVGYIYAEIRGAHHRPEYDMIA